MSPVPRRSGPGLLMRIDGVDHIHTSIVVNEVKASTALPLEAPPRARRGAGR